MKRVLSTAAALLLAAGLTFTAGCEKNNLNKQGNEGPSAQKAGNPSDHTGENGAGAANKQTVAGQAAPNSQPNPRYGGHGVNTDRKGRDVGAPQGSAARPGSETNGELDRNAHSVATAGGTGSGSTATSSGNKPGNASSSNAAGSGPSSPK